MAKATCWLLLVRNEIFYSNFSNSSFALLYDYFVCCMIMKLVTTGTLYWPPLDMYVRHYNFESFLCCTFVCINLISCSFYKEKTCLLILPVTAMVIHLCGYC